MLCLADGTFWTNVVFSFEGSAGSESQSLVGLCLMRHFSDLLSWCLNPLSYARQSHGSDIWAKLDDWHMETLAGCQCCCFLLLPSVAPVLSGPGLVVPQYD